MSVDRGGARADDLTLVGADALGGFTVKNLPNGIVVEYSELLFDGRRFFATRPKVDWQYEDYRVFFGTADNVLERTLVKTPTMTPAGGASMKVISLDEEERNGVTFRCTKSEIAH